MSFFKQAEGEAAVLVERGLYRQVDVYTRDGYLYAKLSGGFVRLMADGSTTRPGVSLDFLSYSGPLAQRLGRLCESGTAGSRELAEPEAQKLLGGQP